MATTIKVARPCIITDATGRKWELGIAVYPDLDDSFASHPIVQAHTEQAVLARNGWLAQWRWLNNAGPTFPGALPLLIWVGRPEAPQYVGGIEGGWPPVFLQHLRHFPDLETPFADFVQTGTDASGVALFRQIGADERIQLSTHQQPRAEQTGATKLFPGDPSPVLGAAGNLDMDRARREEVEHLRQQVASLAATNTEAARYVDAPLRQPEPITWPTPPSPFFTFVDEREARRMAA